MLFTNYQIIIPARKGSKRFPGKNKALLQGIPLIQHSVQFALDEGVLPEQIWVNSDDEEILLLAKNLGVNSYARLPHLADDYASTASVLEDQVVFFKENQLASDAIILLQVTNPLRPKGLIRNAVQLFEQSTRSSLCTFSALNKKFGAIQDQLFIPKNYSPGQRMQDLEPLYFENGLLYISTSSLILDQKMIIGEDVYPMVIDHVYAQVDIDEPDDLLLAEFLIDKS